MPVVDTMPPITDSSDVVAEIGCYFALLNYLQPGEGWGWKHPVMRQWMTDYGFTMCADLTDAALAVVLEAVKRKYQQLLMTNSKLIVSALDAD